MGTEGKGGAEGHTRETRASSRTRLNFLAFFVYAARFCLNLAMFSAALAI